MLEPDYYGAIDVATGRSVLYQPRLDENYAIIMGQIPTPEEVRWYLMCILFKSWFNPKQRLCTINYVFIHRSIFNRNHITGPVCIYAGS